MHSIRDSEFEILVGAKIFGITEFWEDDEDDYCRYRIVLYTDKGTFNIDGAHDWGPGISKAPPSGELIK